MNINKIALKINNIKMMQLERKEKFFKLYLKHIHLEITTFQITGRKVGKNSIYIYGLKQVYLLYSILKTFNVF